MPKVLWIYSVDRTNKPLLVFHFISLADWPYLTHHESYYLTLHITCWSRIITHLCFTTVSTYWTNICHSGGHYNYKRLGPGRLCKHPGECFMCMRAEGLCGCVINHRIVFFCFFWGHCSRIGLDWASSVADILRNLNACPQWCDIIAGFTDNCIKQLPHHFKRTNIFTLHVLVIFPEVWRSERSSSPYFSRCSHLDTVDLCAAVFIKTTRSSHHPLLQNRILTHLVLFDFIAHTCKSVIVYKSNIQGHSAIFVLWRKKMSPLAD